MTDDEIEQCIAGSAKERFLEEQRRKARSDRLKMIGGGLAALFFVYKFIGANNSDNERNAANLQSTAEQCLRAIRSSNSLHPSLASARDVLESKDSLSDSKKFWIRSVCDEDKVQAYYRNYDPNKPYAPVQSAKTMIREAWEEADRSNREANKAMEDMLSGYQKRARSSSTSSSAGVRIDSFVMRDGTVVVCGTTFRNGARVTTCN